MSLPELSAQIADLRGRVIEAGSNIAGIQTYLLPELTARVKRLEEERQSTYEYLHGLTRKFEQQAKVLEALQNADLARKREGT